MPTPPPGFWTKKAFGKRVDLKALPNPGDAREILIREASAANEPDALADARAAVLAALGRAGETPPPNPVVERTLAKLRSAKPNRDGLVRTEASGVVRVDVRRDSVERAAAVLTALVAAGEQAGLALVKAEGGVAWAYAGQTIAFALIEAADQVEHVATQKELAALEKWRRERSGAARALRLLGRLGRAQDPQVGAASPGPADGPAGGRARENRALPLG